MTAFNATAEYATAELGRPKFGLLALAAAFALSGQTIGQARPLEPASFAVTGQSSAAIVKQVCAPGSFGLSGKAIGDVIEAAPSAFTIAAQAVLATTGLASAPGAFALSGQSIVGNLAAALSRAQFALSGQTAAGTALLVSSPASFALAGQPITVAVAGVVAPASFSLSGQSVRYNLAVVLAEAAYALTGQAALFDPAQRCDARALALGGQNIAATLAARLAVANFSLAGQAAEMALPVDLADFVLTGYGATSQTGEPLVPVTLTLYGTPVFRAWRIGVNTPVTPATAEMATAELPRLHQFGLYAATSTFAFSGKPALLTVAPQAAGFVLSGQAAELAMLVDVGAFAVAGQAAVLASSPQAASFILSGQSAQMAMLADVAAFALSGQSAQMAMRTDPVAFTLAAQDLAYRLAQALGKATFTLSGKTILFAFDTQIGRAEFAVTGWAVSDVTGPSGNHIYLIEVQAHDGSSLRTFYLATEGFTSKPGDTPSNTYYEPRIIDPGNFERALFEGTDLRGRAKSGAGDIRIASSDPGNGVTLDDWLEYGWSQREIRIKSLPKGSRTIGDATTLFVGKLDRISSTKPLDYIDLRINDRLADLNLPLLSARFAGTTTSSGATAEGNADLAGTIKQRCWGNCPQVELQPANPYDLIYLASAGEVDSIAVYDGGVALTLDGDDADLATLQAASVSGGHYRTCLAEGLVKLGATPAYTLRADVVEGATSDDRTAGQIAYRMLIAYGFSSAAISVGSIDELDALNAAEVGYSVNDDRIALAAVQDVLDSIGAWMVPNRDGTLVFGRFGAPAATPQSTFDLDDDAITDSLDRVDNDLPVWRVILEYGPVFAPQGDQDLAGAVGAERRAYLAKPFRTVVAEDSSIKTKHLSAREITIRTWLTSDSAAGTEASRQLTLLSADRARYELTLPLVDGWATVPGDSIGLRHPDRLGLSGGKPFNVLRRVDNYAGESVQLSIWG